MTRLTAGRQTPRHIILEGVGSTNDEALSYARSGDPGNLWVQARAQSKGRGRSGRPWSSPPGNLYATLLLVDPADPRDAPQLGLVAGLALARAVRRLPGIAKDVAIKWPNDLLHAGAKFSGILVEGAQLVGGSFAAAIGFGVNCTSHPAGLDYPVTDLAAIAGRPIDADQVLERLSAEMAEVLALWDRGRGFGSVRDGWLAHALPRGSALAARTSTGLIEGFFDTIDERGRLILATAAGPTAIDAADIFLRRSAAASQPPQGEIDD